MTLIKITGTLPLAQLNVIPGTKLANSADLKTGAVTRWNQENYRLIFTSNDSSFDKSDLIGSGAVSDGLYEGGVSIINENFKVPVSIKNIYTSYGYLYTPDRLKNSSNVATYVTKEISIDNPGNSINLVLNAALQEIDDVTVMFKTKRSSQQISHVKAKKHERGSFQKTQLEANWVRMDQAVQPAVQPDTCFLLPCLC